MMRASEALMAGSLLLRPLGCIRNDGNGNGCALGMMEMAHGIDAGKSPTFPSSEFKLDYDIYPWLRSVCIHSCPVCGESFYLYPAMGILIAHIFDYHIAEIIVLPDPKKGRWTIEQLADFIEAHDPTPKEVSEVEQAEIPHERKEVEV